MHKPDDWLRALHVNVSAPFALTQACMPLLTQASDSAVVFVLDDPELLQRAHWGAYGVSKAALERFVAILHEETTPGPMRTHALLPAPMRTALAAQAYFGEDIMQRTAAGCHRRCSRLSAQRAGAPRAVPCWTCAWHETPHRQRCRRYA
jgi:NAD(P)-dependent dehydrogenase (short-subunit alcohol dehydrogenase family)